MAERPGFEPGEEIYPFNCLAGSCLQPLGHLSELSFLLYSLKVRAYLPSDFLFSSKKTKKSLESSIRIVPIQ